jgi:hypothetical protein
MRTLLLLALCFVSLPVSAEELQVTISGFACVFVSSITECNRSGSFATPTTITYDIDSISGLQTSSLGQAPFTGSDVLFSYEASDLAVTNYSAILGGQSVGFAAQTTGRFSFAVEGPTAYDFFGGAGPGYDFDSFATPLVSATEFATFQDPLASLLLKYRSPSDGAFCGGFCFLDGFPVFAKMTIVAVPTPGPLPLLLPGLVGLVIWRRRKQSGLSAAANH